MNFFKRPATHYGKTPEPVTPYQRAAQVWDERIGSSRVQARNWRAMAFGCLAAGFASALIWQSARGTVVPWVVEIDRHGEARAVEAAAVDFRPTDPQVAWHLARFIEQVRGLPADPIVVRQNWLRAYEFTTDRGAIALNDHARANDPFSRARPCSRPSACRRPPVRRTVTSPSSTPRWIAARSHLIGLHRRLHPISFRPGP